ncbi:lipase family protein [Agromyces arachidis]|uniref:lipase family protein n=1 Tax=Agromyces arachidis TaxID=766966 RepID=UPI0040567FAD
MTDRIDAWFARLPRWVRGVVGVVAVVLGAVILTRPTTSLGVLAILIGAGMVLSGILELVGGGDPDDERRGPRWRLVTAALWIVAGVLVLLLPGLTVRLVAVAVAVAIIVNGGLSLAAAFRTGASWDARVASVLLGAAQIVFGLLAMLWPDITLLVVAVVFGARLMIVGLLLAWHAVRGSRREAPDDGPPSGPRRWARTIAAVVAVLLAVIAGSVSATLREGSPVVDEFYAAPRDVPSEPGRLIRAEPFTRGVPADATAWRILYTTTGESGDPAVASGLVVVPTDGADFPVIDWTHGTTGFAQPCAPSLADQPFESGALFLLPEVIENGWALVATDYLGLGTPGPHPYLIGRSSAYAALDARRAASELTEAKLGDQTVVWGHSQGGGAALWTGAVADEYAPELGLQGVAALAPASNLTGLMENLPNVTGGSIFQSFVIAAYTAVYPDVSYREYVRPGAEATVREMADRCLAEPSSAVTLLELLGLSRDPRIDAADPTTGAFGERLEENTPPATISAPLLLGQGADDQLVVRPAQDEYVEGLCADGQQVDYRIYAGRDHVPLVEPDSPLVPDLLAWTAERFAGEAVEPGCVTTER